MKNRERKIKAFKWIISSVIFAFFLYGIFNFITNITVHPNNCNIVSSYEKLKSSFRDENYVFPDLSKLESDNSKYTLIMDGSTLLSKPQTFYIEVEYPHEICNIRYQILSYLSAYDETELPESVHDRSTFSVTEYKNTPIHIQHTRYDSAISIGFYFTVDEHHYSVGASYYTEKRFDSREQEGVLTQAEQQEVETVIYTEVKKIVHQMIDKAATQP